MTGNGGDGGGGDAGGGHHPRARRDSCPDPSSGQDEWEEERRTDKQRAMAPCRGKEGGGGKKNTSQPVWIVLGGDTEDTPGRVGGCQGGKGASSLSSIFHTLTPLFFLLPLPSFHASVLLFLASRGSAAKANKQTRLFIPASGE